MRYTTQQGPLRGDGRQPAAQPAGHPGGAPGPGPAGTLLYLLTSPAPGTTAVLAQPLSRLALAAPASLTRRDASTHGVGRGLGLPAPPPPGLALQTRPFARAAPAQLGWGGRRPRPRLPARRTR